MSAGAGFKEGGTFVAEQQAGEEQEFTVVDKRGSHRDTEERDEPKAPEPAASGREVRQAPGVSPDLASLFLMLGTSALIHLGEAPDPSTGQPAQDLTQARYAIDLLGLLKEKTEGNRSPEEGRLLDDLLYDLRIRYLQAAKLAG